MIHAVQTDCRVCSAGKGNTVLGPFPEVMSNPVYAGHRYTEERPLTPKRCQRDSGETGASGDEEGRGHCQLECFNQETFILGAGVHWGLQV